jgi:hypothetical protein
MSVLPVKSGVVVPALIHEQIAGYASQQQSQSNIQKTINLETQTDLIDTSSKIQHEVDFYGFPKKGIYLDIFV